MCRWVAYRGKPIFLGELICAPTHSLVAQSLHAQEAKTMINGDGFGLGWYARHPDPALYHEILPAWSDENLKGLCRHVDSRLFFAHIRASTGSCDIARANCHPFVVGVHMFMHNGQIGDYSKIKRKIDNWISDDLYKYRHGATDSEALFLLIMTRLKSMNIIQSVTSVLHDACQLMSEHNIREALRFTAAITDGQNLYAFRWSSDKYAPSLYWCEDEHDLIVVSEPLDRNTNKQWHCVPANHALIALKDKPVYLHNLKSSDKVAA